MFEREWKFSFATQRTGMITITVEILDARTVCYKLIISPTYNYLVVGTVPGITIAIVHEHNFQFGSSTESVCSKLIKSHRAIAFL